MDPRYLAWLRRTVLLRGVAVACELTGLSPFDVVRLAGEEADIRRGV